MNSWLKTGSQKITDDNFVMPFFKDKQIELVKYKGFIENSDNLQEYSNPAVSASDPKHCSNKRSVKRKYDESCPGFGFTWTDSEDCPEAPCVIFIKTVAK